MSVNLRSDASFQQLDRRAEPEEHVTAEQVKDAQRVARILMRILADVAMLKRRWWPRRIDFEDTDVDGTGTTLYPLTHGLGGRVRYWVVRWDGAASPNLREDDSTDDNKLVLTSTSAGTATIRVEEAG